VHRIFCWGFFDIVSNFDLTDCAADYKPDINLTDCSAHFKSDKRAYKRAYKWPNIFAICKQAAATSEFK
jgi:hypothetical protein